MNVLLSNLRTTTNVSVSCHLGCELILDRTFKSAIRYLNYVVSYFIKDIYCKMKG